LKYFVQAPTRISLFGGGTDVGEYAEKYGGICVNMAINIRQKYYFDINSEGYDDDMLFDYNLVGDGKLEEAFFKEFDYRPKELLQEFDNSIHSGLGSSASASVCLVYALSKLTGIELTKYEIAEKAWDIEVNKVGLFGGKQDQYCAVFGGMNLMKFGKEVKVLPFQRKAAERLAKHILLFDTGIKREDSKIQENLKEITSEQKQVLDIMKNLANDAYHRIYKGGIEGLGRLLDNSWRYKKQSNKVTTPEIDMIYNKAKDLGAYGGKLCGSGGGGYMIFIVPKEKQEYFKNNVGLRWVDFEIDWQGVNGRFL